jgi:hypothetical protein
MSVILSDRGYYAEFLSDKCYILLTSLLLIAIMLSVILMRVTMKVSFCSVAL